MTGVPAVPPSLGLCYLSVRNNVNVYMTPGRKESIRLLSGVKRGREGNRERACHVNHFGMLKTDSRLTPNHSSTKLGQDTVKHVSTWQVYESEL